MNLTNQIARCLLIASGLFFLSFELGAAQPRPSPTQDPLPGSRVFRSKGCVSCHAINGIGGGVGPDLGRVPRPQSFFELAAALWNHLPEMGRQIRKLGVSAPHLSPQEIGDLMSFLYTLAYLDPPGSVRSGRKLFTTKKCVACHQIGGTGGVLGPSLDSVAQYGSPIFVAAAMWNHGPGMARAMQERKIERPVFNASELVDLVAYLRSASKAPVEGSVYVLPGKAERGLRLFEQKRCVECHSVKGQGGNVGPDLGGAGQRRNMTDFAVAMWNKAPAMVKAMQAKGVSVPNLSAAEMADLVAYLYSVQYFAGLADRGTGQSLLRVKGCLGCHELGGAGGNIGPSFSRIIGLDSPATVIAGLWNHLPLMDRDGKKEKVSWPPFNAEEMAGLVSYLQTVGRKQP